jgi:hypothetical protein
MHIPAHIRNIAIPLGAPLHKDGSSMSSIIKIAVIFYVRKDFTDPHTLLIALGITIVSVVEGGIQMEDTSGDFGNHYLWFSNGTGFAGSHDCGNFSGSDGNIVKCEWRRSFSDVDYPNFGREEVAFKHVDYIICRKFFIKQKQPFLLRNVFI